MVKIGPTYSAKITIDSDVVTKKIIFGSIPGKSRRTYSDLFDRELWALKQLNGLKHFPHLIGYNKEALELKTIWCGEPIHKLPKNWRAQADIIIKSLNNNGILHLDIALKNITCLNETIHLVDFGECRSLRDDLNFPDVVVDTKKSSNSDLIKVLRGCGERGDPNVEVWRNIPAESHVFVIWDNNRAEDICIDISKRFKILHAKKFTMRGYHRIVKMREVQNQECDNRGKRGYTVVVILDNKPSYVNLHKFYIKELPLVYVNQNVYGLKTTLREIHGGYKIIHSSDVLAEAQKTLEIFGLEEYNAI
jgi:hypothetical protein